MNNSISLLNSLGQSIWYDNIQRRLIENGELAQLINRGDIKGITSNPSIFHSAIAKSTDYDRLLTPLAWSGQNAEEIFWALAIEDIRAAADLLAPLYESSHKLDGYVSLEVNPLLANDTSGTISQAKSLWRRVARPNLMIKIPATPAGIPAIREVIADGINVNVTLIFSLARYAEVMDAYLDGLEGRVASGHPIEHVASVASFFISRLDTKVDNRLQQLIDTQPNRAEKLVTLMGDASVANAKLAYASFEQVFTSKRFSELREKFSAQIQRPLWASTSTKNPNYSDTLYVDELIGPDTVNTMPPKTLDAFRDHGVVESTLTRNLPQAHQVFYDLEEQGIDLRTVTQELENEGVKAFAEAFSALLETIEARRMKAAEQLGPYLASVSRRISQLTAENTAQRLYSMDPGLWTQDPEGQREIRSRLGWLRAVSNFATVVPEIKSFKQEIISAGFKKALLLGMGGSSLAPEVMESVLSKETKDGLEFSILDSTDPVQVAAAADDFPPDVTFYIVSSKSGGTAEVSALFNYFWELSGRNGSQFIAITDPNTALEDQAKELGFRRIFLGDPTVGGRFSALTPFGLVPAALMGIDLEKFLARAEQMVKDCSDKIPLEMNPGIALGAVLGQMSLDGRDKLTIIADKSLAPMGSWLEQLIAESSGKNGKGIVVVDGEALRDPGDYGKDRLFVYLRREGEFDTAIKVLVEEHPIVIINMHSPDDLAAEFYRWEVATAIACSVLGVNAFDQPDVQLSKDITRKIISQYSQTKTLEEGTPVWLDEQIKIFSPSGFQGTNIQQVLKEFLSAAKEDDFIGINAYLPRNADTTRLLAELRLKLGRMTGCATTLGFGPRYLHSTGQLHKGGKNSGVFVQITMDVKKILEIPGQNMTFGNLELAQALGDFEALVSRGRRVIRMHYSSLHGLRSLVESLKN